MSLNFFRSRSDSSRSYETVRDVDLKSHMFEQALFVLLNQVVSKSDFITTSSFVEGKLIEQRLQTNFLQDVLCIFKHCLLIRGKFLF